MNVGRLLTRTAVVLMVIGALAIGCGGGGGGDDEGLEGPVTPGFFTGQTDQGEPMSIQVDTIRAVFVSCGGAGFEYIAVYDPPEPVSVEGDFAVSIVDDARLRFLTVTGSFQSQDRVKGTISGDPFCDGGFDLRRCNPDDPKCKDQNGNHIPDGIQPTPRPTVTTTPTATPTATATAGTPTSTASDATPVVTPTPTATATPDTEDVCGDGIVEGAEDCDGNNLDNTTCDDLSFDGGTLSCNADCSFNESGCFDNP